MATRFNRQNNNYKLSFHHSVLRSKFISDEFARQFIGTHKVGVNRTSLAIKGETDLTAAEK